MGLFNFLRKKEKRDIFAERRQYLLAHGRITDGRIIDSETTQQGREVVFYTYSLNGVDFESSELLSDQQMTDPLRYAPGAKVGVRYDPKNQGNSMLV